MQVPFEIGDQLDEIPHRVLAQLRTQCPVAKTAAGTTYLATYDDVLAATKAVDVFEGSFREPGVVIPPEEQFISEIPEPRHGQVRRLINSAIAYHRIRHIEPYVAELCESSLVPLLDRGPVELIGEWISPIPIKVIATLLGVPPSDHALFRRWSDEVLGGTVPYTNRNERGEGLAGGHPEFSAYLDAQIAERRASDDPPDDLVTRLIHAEIEGQRLTDTEIRTQLVFLILSGNETTRHLIGNLAMRVAQDRDLFETLKAQPAHIEAAVEESLRLDSPIHMLARNCIADTEVRGVPIERGSKVMFGLASANRQDDRYEDPDTFSLNRSNGRDHLAFGGGPHVCPGSSLARMEGRVAVETLCQMVDRIDLDPEAHMVKTAVFWANGPDTLPVTLSTRPTGQP